MDVFVESHIVVGDDSVEATLNDSALLSLCFPTPVLLRSLAGSALSRSSFELLTRASSTMRAVTPLLTTRPVSPGSSPQAAVIVCQHCEVVSRILFSHTLNFNGHVSAIFCPNSCNNIMNICSQYENHVQQYFS